MWAGLEEGRNWEAGRDCRTMAEWEPQCAFDQRDEHQLDLLCLTAHALHSTTAAHSFNLCTAQQPPALLS